MEPLTLGAIDEMPAGRDMDEAITEAVFGWRKHEWVAHKIPAEIVTAWKAANIAYPLPGPEWWVCQECGSESTGLHPEKIEDDRFFDPGLKYCGHARLPRHSTEIAAAWEVDQEGWEWDFADTALGVKATVYLPDTDYASAIALWAEAPTKAAAYALARCRAALKAVMTNG